MTGNATAVLAKSDTISTALLQEIKKILDDMGKPHQSPESRVLKTAKKILVVEDNQTAMIQIKTVLESEGYLVDTASGGAGGD